MTFQQVQLYMNAKNLGHPQQTAAAKAGLSPRTARRIASGTQRPKRGRPRDWKTHADPLDGHWEADLLPKALFACGGVPQPHRTDSLSAAYRHTGGRNPQLTQMAARSATMLDCSPLATIQV